MRKCSILNCERTHWGLGYCQLHYYRFKHNGDPLISKKSVVRKDLTCIYKDCKNFRRKREYCWNHYVLIMGYRPKMAKYAQKKGKENKLIIFNHYGNKCTCCGESNIKFLTISHKNNDGNTQRKKTRATYSLFYWIIKNNFPDDLQLECWNCNCGKQYNGGICPHKEVNI